MRRLGSGYLLDILMGCLYCGLSSTVLAASPVETDASAKDCQPQFTFSWQFIEGCDLQPRGGTTRGANIVLDPEPHPGWLALQEAGLSDFERDRRAILAMAGPYRTSFDFIETVGYTPGFKPDKPYQSWGTEYVYVAADDGDFISLQHIMVMFFADKDGAVHGPMVMKHWRQDWQYQDRDMHVYKGHNTWAHQRLSKKAAAGRWTQAVFQVDDTPRYEAAGQWQHEKNFSSWLSDHTWRPLPRREFSVRDDYQALAGINRHTITPNGWVHEQENLKLVLDKTGQPADVPYLAKELGVNRYERVIEHDFSAGDIYWQYSGPFWSDVRSAWAQVLAKHKTLRLKKVVQGKPLYQALFSYADKVVATKAYNAAAGKAFAEATIAQYVEAP